MTFLIDRPLEHAIYALEMVLDYDFEVGNSSFRLRLLLKNDCDGGVGGKHLDYDVISL